MKIAVTAVSGKLGGAIAQALIQEIGADQVIGIARTPQKAAHLGIEIRQGDYTDRTSFENALQGVDAVLLVSGMDAPDKRIEQHRNVIEAAKSKGVNKIVYTSIVGDPERTAFAPIIQSNRQTEEDVMASGLEWAIGRNGLYIEPDLEYIAHYKEAGVIANCAGNGLCAYTSRSELGYAYAKMLTENEHNNKTYHLVGEPITQQQLAETINEVYGTSLSFQNMSTEDYMAERKEALGAFLGVVISGIYDGISNGAFNPKSDYEKAAGRPHKSVFSLIQEYQAQES